MSYVVTNMYENPGPYYGTSDKGEPVPGWGPLPVMAGGERVGVGQLMPVADEPVSVPRFTLVEKPIKRDVPWSKVGAGLFVLGAVALGAGLWMRKKKR